MGAEILTYPSAFTYQTGAAHWEVILRARAIENQSYVVAAAQTGAHNKKRVSWGHAMVDTFSGSAFFASDYKILKFESTISLSGYRPLGHHSSTMCGKDWYSCDGNRPCDIRKYQEKYAMPETSPYRFISRNEMSKIKS